MIDMFNVKNADFEDVKLMSEIMVKSFRYAFSAFISKQTMDAYTIEENCRVMLENLYIEGKMHFLLGEKSGMLVWQNAEDNLAEIVAIHSLPKSFGTGLGEAMLKKALSQMKETGQKSVFLWAFKENKRARRFYEKHGFTVDGTERISEFDDAVEVRYIKNI